MIVVLDCQKCGGPLNVSSETEIVACPYCGSRYAVSQAGDTLRIRRLEQRVERVGEYVTTDQAVKRTRVEIEKARPRAEERQKAAGCLGAIPTVVILQVVFAAAGGGVGLRRWLSPWLGLLIVLAIWCGFTVLLERWFNASFHALERRAEELDERLRTMDVNEESHGASSGHGG